MTNNDEDLLAEFFQGGIAEDEPLSEADFEKMLGDLGLSKAQVGDAKACEAALLRTVASAGLTKQDALRTLRPPTEGILTRLLRWFRHG